MAGLEEQVRELLVAGEPRTRIARRLGVSRGTVSRYAARVGFPSVARGPSKYNWAEVREFYAQGHSIDESGLSVRQCMKRFGFCSATWHDAVKRGVIVPRPTAMPIEQLLVVGRRGTSRTHLKSRLIKEGLKENRCEMCGISEWLGKPLSLELHHVNGRGNDNRLENLQLLCGNCHSQTDNWGGRGIRRKVEPGKEAA